MVNCKCHVNLSYQANDDTMKVILDKIVFCPRHDAAPLIAALEEIKSHFGKTLLIGPQYDHAALYSQGANAAFNQMAEIATAVLAKLEVTHENAS